MSKTSDGVSASMQVGTHEPKVNAKWPLKFTVTSKGKPAKATVSYEWLYAGAVVHKQNGKSFTGHFTETFVWPAAAIGKPLTLRAVVVSGKAEIYLDYAIKVVK